MADPLSPGISSSQVIDKDDEKIGGTIEEMMKDGKVIILFKNTGNAPPLKQKKFKLQASASFSTVIDFLRKMLRYKPTDSLFLFVNCTFQPSPDEIISELFKCFHNNGKLVINYCTTAAWG
eukprot:TRINITY_DN2683_c0_g1_i1.p3 TRINITY_DN2683_c0_g1~~TRINITY_DN2683_c0_g1_i1.p3  ORF type:complete len:121 (-),score=22.52 TRINITY_DN2683_c0_g1_i1:40-402(-)